MRRLSLLSCILLVAVGLFTPAWLYAATGQLCFNVPGITNCIDGRFREYWDQNGGLPVFGYPISPAAMQQTADGSFLTQYFERNRFELHPDKARPYDVLLGRLGDDRLKQEGRDWFSLPKGQQTPGCLWFADTGHSVCDQENGVGFKSYWEGHGLQDPALNKYAQSLALFGLPLSEPAVETNTSGATVLTQWFERGRFEYYPTNQAAFKVLLGLLGNETHAAPAPQPTPQPTPVPQPTQPPASPCGTVPSSVNARVDPTNCVHKGDVVGIFVSGFTPNEDVGFWLTAPNGDIIGTVQTLNIGPDGGGPFLQWHTADAYPGLWYWVVQGTKSGHKSIAYIDVLP